MGSRNCPFNSLWEGSPESIHNGTIVELQTALNSLTALGRRGRVALLIAVQKREGAKIAVVELMFLHLLTLLIGVLTFYLAHTYYQKESK